MCGVRHFKAGNRAIYQAGEGAVHSILTCHMCVFDRCVHVSRNSKTDGYPGRLVVTTGLRSDKRLLIMYGVFCSCCVCEGGVFFFSSAIMSYY